MSDQNKAAARRVLEEIVGKGDLSLVDELISEDYLGHIETQEDTIEGPEHFKQFVALYQATFPELRFAVDDQIAEGDKVATRWTATGRIPSFGGDSDQPVSVMGISMQSFRDGKVIESWDAWESLGVMQSSSPDLFESLRISM